MNGPLPGDRVSWPELPTADGGTIAAGTGQIIARDNFYELVRSDEVVAVHQRQPPETGEWPEHRLLRISVGHLTLVSRGVRYNPVTGRDEPTV